MFEIIKIEKKRVFNYKILLLFFLLITFYSVYSSYVALQNYNILDEKGVVAEWNENLAHGKEYSQGTFMNLDYLSFLKTKPDLIYIDETNVELLVSLNFDGKKLADLTLENMKDFYKKRVVGVQERLDENNNIKYTDIEKNSFIEKAKKLTDLQMGYAEGWKVLQRDLGKYVVCLQILISLLLLPLFGSDPQTKMKELYRSTKFGKKKLDYARIATSYIFGFSLYLMGILLFFVIKMVPFGLEGGNLAIQSNELTFFSVYNISFCQQFVINVFIGLAAMFFMISFTLLITVLLDSYMAGAVLLVFFWILLIVLDQMGLYPVNHFFANFMPLKMTNFSHFYTQNEIYRVNGFSIPCLHWNLFVTSLLSVLILMATVAALHVKGKMVKR